MPVAEINVHDVEVYPNFFCVTIKDRINNKILIFRIGDVSGQSFNDLASLVEYYLGKNRWFVGYNSLGYDDRIINFLIQNRDTLNWLPPIEIAERIKRLSDKIIVEDDQISYKWDIPYRRIDIVRLGRKGNMYRPLKMTAVSLKYHTIKDLPFEPNQIIEEEHREKLELYNLDDVRITDMLYDKFLGDIRLRKYISTKYKIDVMNDPDSGIADKLLLKLYSERTGIDPYDLKTSRTVRERVKLEECISDKIKFKTKPLQEFLNLLKNTSVTPDSKLEHKLLVGETYYTIAKGGIHSDRQPEIHKRRKNRKIIDCDVASYYPRIMILLGLVPEHLGKDFLEILVQLTEERLAQKAKFKETGDQQAELEQMSLKITINAIFGKTGYDRGWLYDLKTMYSVTLNGQLFLLMLIEALELRGISVFYANTDGITVDIPESLESTYYEVCKAWESYTGFELDYDDTYKQCIIVNVNNYLIIKDKERLPEGAKFIKVKGTLDYNAWKNLSDKKAFDKPIVSKALYKYWVNNIPIEDTIRNHEDIHDFCMAEKVGSTWDKVVLSQLIDNQLETSDLQRTNRYFVTRMHRESGTLSKIQLTQNGQVAKTTSICAGEYLYIANDIEKVPSHVKPKYEWYIKEAYKIISSLEGQLGLFDEISSSGIL